MGKVPVPKGFWQRSAEELAIAYPPSYANNNTGYIEVKRNKRMILLHRWLWNELVGTIPEGFQVDHKNGVRTDNRIENLRVVEHKVNSQNQSKRSDNKSGVTGVGWTMPAAKWRARWYENGKLCAKCFDDFEDACKHRELMIQQLNSKGNHYTERHGT